MRLSAPSPLVPSVRFVGWGNQKDQEAFLAKLEADLKAQGANYTVRESSIGPFYDDARFLAKVFKLALDHSCLGLAKMINRVTGLGNQRYGQKASHVLRESMVALSEALKDGKPETAQKVSQKLKELAEFQALVAEHWS